MYFADMERRLFLQRLLKIPSALLGLTWCSILDEQMSDEDRSSYDQVAELITQDAYYVYEDVLVLGWGAMYGGGAPDVASRVDRRLRKLVKIVEHVPTADAFAWQSLLCNFYQLTTRFAQKHVDLQRALHDAAEAISIAEKLDDTELLASSHFRRIRVYMECEQYENARNDTRAAMEYVKRVRNPLQGNIYLIAAEVEALWARGDQTQQKTVRGWQDKVLNSLYKNTKIEDDGTFLKLNLAAAHHERAKTMLQFYLDSLPESKVPTLARKRNRLLSEAHSEMSAAWKHLDPDVLSWHINFHVTDAKLCKAENDLEGSGEAAKSALKIAKSMDARHRNSQLRQLYYTLKEVDAKNIYIRNLGVELNIF